MGDLILRCDHRAVVVMDPEREWVFAADPVGRVSLVHAPEGSWRRSRENRWFRLVRAAWTGLEPVAEEEVRDRLRQWQKVWERARDQVRARSGLGLPMLVRVLEIWCTDFWGFHERDAQAFRNLYGAIPILPPDAYATVYLRVTEGCPWNRCAFCSFYRDRRFRVLGMDTLRDHLVAVRRYWNGALGSRTGLFLGDANALVLSEHALIGRLREIRSVFPEPRLRQIHAFVDAFTGPRWTQEGLRELYQQGLVRLSVGVESGDPELMQCLRKPVDSRDLERMVRAAKGAGLALNLIFIIGLGGRRKREDHFRATMGFLSRVPLSFPDRVYLSPLWVDPDAEYPQLAREHDWQELTEEELKAEMVRWRDAIRKVCPRVQVSLYNIRFFAY